MQTSKETHKTLDAELKRGKKSGGEGGGSKRVSACVIHYWAEPQPNPQ